MGGKTSNESKAKYNAKAYDRINIAVPKGRKAEVQAHAAPHGESVNSYINRAITEALERDGAVSESSKDYAESKEEAGE